MKVLLTGPDYFNYTESVAWAIEEEGHQVECIPYRGYEEQCSYLEKKIIKLGFAALKEGYKKKWNELLRDRLQKADIEGLIVLNGEWIDPEVLAEAQNRGCQLTLWLIDSIRRMPENERNVVVYNNVYSFEPSDIPYLKKKCNVMAKYLSVGYDPRVYVPQAVEKDIDICFIGAATAKRLAVLQQVAIYAKRNQKQMLVHGRYWSKRYFWKKMKFFRRYSPLGEFIENCNISPAEVASIYRRSRICLNIHIEEHDGPNPRIFEILGTKSFQLVDDKKTLECVIQSGEEIISYTNVADLLEKIDYYLQHEKEAAAIVEKGFARVIREHGIQQKVAVLLNEVNNGTPYA